MSRIDANLEGGKALNKKLTEMDDELHQVLFQIQVGEEWNRLSIVEVTALLDSTRRWNHGGGTLATELSDARRLFFELRHWNQKLQRDLDSNHRVYAESLKADIEALKKELRTPEEIAADEAETARRLARRRAFS